MIKSMDMENSNGPMEEYIKDNGLMVNNTELVFIKEPMVKKERENG
jgi:hypothetical protein